MHFSQNLSTFLHRSQVQAHITEEMQPTFKYVTLLILSTFLAHLGLMASQPTVTLGAMLISPLMWPILGLALGVVSGRPPMILRSALVGVVSILFVIGLSSVLTLAFDPAAVNIEEMVAQHMSPTLFDLAIALLTGIAAAFIVSWEKVSDAAAGVAIASSLVLPTTVTGIGVTLGNTDIIQGSFLLFMTNTGSILLTGMLIFLFLGHHQRTDKTSTEILTAGVLGSGVVLLLLTLPLTSTFFTIMEGNALRSLAQTTLEKELMQLSGGISMDSITTRDLRVGTGSKLQVTALLRGDEGLRLPYTEVRSLEERLTKTLKKDVQLDLRLLPPVVTLTEDLVAKEARLALEAKVHQVIATFLKAIDRRMAVESLSLSGSMPLLVTLNIKAPSQTEVSNEDRLRLREVLEKELLRSVRLEMSVLRVDVITDETGPQPDETLSSLETAVDRFAARTSGTEGIEISQRKAEHTESGYVLKVHLRLRADTPGIQLYLTSLRNTLLSDFPAQSTPLRLEITTDTYTTL